LGRHDENPGRLHYNLGVAPVDAKGTTPDYLTHPSAIPAQIMAANPVFSGVVKTPDRYQAGSSQFMTTKAAYPVPL
jgi:hypothetical protein